MFLDAEGRPALELRTLERADEDLRPLLFQVQETDAEGRSTPLAFRQRRTKPSVVWQSRHSGSSTPARLRRAMADQRHSPYRV